MIAVVAVDHPPAQLRDRDRRAANRKTESDPAAEVVAQRAQSHPGYERRAPRPAGPTVPLLLAHPAPPVIREQRVAVRRSGQAGQLVLVVVSINYGSRPNQVAVIVINVRAGRPARQLGVARHRCGPVQSSKYKAQKESKMPNPKWRWDSRVSK